MRTLLPIALLLSTTALADGPDIPEPAWIINGEEALLEEYPMSGAMIFEADIDSFMGAMHLRTAMCSSTLIAPDTVLLAAHCVDEELLTQSLTMGMGTVDNIEIHWSRQVDLQPGGDGNITLPEDAIGVWETVGHAQFDMNTLSMGLADNHDIALMFLDEPVLDVPFAYLPQATVGEDEESEIDQIVVDSLVDVVGWGQQTQVDFMEQPPPGTVGIKQIGTSHIAEIDEYEFKVGEVASDVRKCHGDSGGPSYLTITTETLDAVRLVGVTSHAYDESDCASTGGVDTRVDYHLDWIDDQMSSRCEDGSRAWCEELGIPAPPYPDEGGALACGCSASSTPAGAGLLGLLGLPLLLLRRRRTAS